jgi:hypothetical protein
MKRFQIITAAVVATLAAGAVFADSRAHVNAVHRNGEWIDVEGLGVDLTIIDTEFGGGNTTCNIQHITFNVEVQTYTVKASCENAARHENVMEYWHLIYSENPTMLVRVDATNRHNGAPPVIVVYRKKEH